MPASECPYYRGEVVSRPSKTGKKAVPPEELSNPSAKMSNILDSAGNRFGHSRL